MKFEERRMFLTLRTQCSVGVSKMSTSSSEIRTSFPAPLLSSLENFSHGCELVFYYLKASQEVQRFLIVHYRCNQLKDFFPSETEGVKDVFEQLKLWNMFSPTLVSS
ncbi:hypothetical protein GOODEAATRI_019428 [Goodea atripinnis]|uniref:Uncharacterized protein n=1 Tax=Goodea atripinnis TaxID=208336 RepID=A0ABV0N2U5_9TELE